MSVQADSRERLRADVDRLRRIVSLLERDAPSRPPVDGPVPVRYYALLLTFHGLVRRLERRGVDLPRARAC